MIKSSLILLLFVMLPITMACAQQGKCVTLNYVYPIRCPNSGCGELYPAYLSEGCDLEGPCVYLGYTSWCCGQYMNVQVQGRCLLAEMKGKRVRSRILELAKKNEIVVPTCSGAYVPARIALQEGGERNNGGL